MQENETIANPTNKKIKAETTPTTIKNDMMQSNIFYDSEMMIDSSRITTKPI